MEKELMLKVWKMDYSFLIKNYLNPELWQKTWTLFQYKNFEITLCLDQIQTRDQKLRFLVKCLYHKDTEKYMNYCSDDVYYSLKLNDISFLKRAINSAIWNCMNNIEKLYFIEYTEDYNDLNNQAYEERYALEKIANDFLDEIGVTSTACREAYTEAYVEENWKLRDLRNEYVKSRQFLEITDFWIAWISCLEDESRADNWLNNVKEACNGIQWSENLKEANEYIKYMQTEDYTKDMKNNLEDI